MTALDTALLALTAWRENRGGGSQGMQSVINVIMNRVAARQSSPYEECVRPWQFSSITAKGDPQLGSWPARGDPQMAVAIDMAQQAVAGQLPDLTNGATSYYAESMTEPPNWALKMEQTAVIAGQVFFKVSA